MRIKRILSVKFLLSAVIFWKRYYPIIFSIFISRYYELMGFDLHTLLLPAALAGCAAVVAKMGI
jgi:hypothetical protein